VVVASRSQGSIDETVSAIRSSGGEALGLQVDVGDRASVFDMVEKSVAAFGGLDVLVNNAQSFGSPKAPAGSPVFQPLETYDEDDWEHTLRTGLTATLWGMKAAFPHMKERGGQIINFASAAGLRGVEGMAAYNCTKEAIRALTRTGAREWGKYNIRVNVICPTIKTATLGDWAEQFPEHAEQLLAQTPLRRWGDPMRDVGGLAVFLASDQSSYMTGMNFMLDGGSHMLT